MQVPVVAVVRPALGMWNVPGSNCSRLRWPTGDASTVPIRSRAPHSPPSPGTRRPIGGWVPDPAAYYCFPVDSASRASAWAARKNLLRPRSPMVSTLNACCNAAASASETPARALTGALRISSWNLPSPADASRRVCARGAAAHRRIRRRTRRRTRRRDAAVAPLPRPLASRSQRRRGAGRAIRGAAHLREPPKCHQGRQPAGSHAPVRRDGAALPTRADTTSWPVGTVSPPVPRQRPFRSVAYPPAGLRPHAEIRGAVARSSPPAATLARCSPISASVAMLPATNRSRTWRTVAVSSTAQAGEVTGKNPSASIVDQAGLAQQPGQGTAERQLRSALRQQRPEPSPQPVRQLLRRAVLVGADRRLQRRVGVLKDQPAARSQRRPP